MHHRYGGILAPLLALVVALRVIAAPLVLAAPEPGLIAICSGGQIYYVTLDGTPVDDDAPQGDPCPFMGIPLALADPPPVIPVPRQKVTDIVQPTAHSVALPARPVAINPARAPPLFV